MLGSDKNTKVCSNYFLQAQFEMKSGHFDEALVSIQKAFELLELSKIEFGNDVDVVRAKFYALRSNVNFVLHRYVDSLESATQGIAHVDQVKSQDPQVLRAVANTKRDLINN